MRDRLIEKLTETFDEQYEKRMLITPQHTADSLLADGWIRPPCKVGDTVYATGLPNERIFPNVVEGYVIGVEQREHGLYLSVLFDTRKISGTYNYNTELWLGKKLFLTREEAEAKLKEGKG